MLEWDIYSVTSSQQLHGVKFRGKLRLFAIKNNINLLAENATDIENCVRFAVQSGQDIRLVTEFIKSIVSDIKIDKTLEKVTNPVLSKMKVNDYQRYES